MQRAVMQTTSYNCTVAVDYPHAKSWHTHALAGNAAS